MATMTDLDKLRMLLPHWIEHNAEHAGEFSAWAEKARAAGQADAAATIEKAAAQLGEVNETLNAALKALG